MAAPHELKVGDPVWYRPCGDWDICYRATIASNPLEWRPGSWFVDLSGLPQSYTETRYPGGDEHRSAVTWRPVEHCFRRRADDRRDTITYRRMVYDMAIATAPR